MLLELTRFRSPMPVVAFYFLPGLFVGSLIVWSQFSLAAPTVIHSWKGEIFFIVLQHIQEWLQNVIGYIKNVIGYIKNVIGYIKTMFTGITWSQYCKSTKDSVQDVIAKLESFHVSCRQRSIWGFSHWNAILQLHCSTIIMKKTA